MWAGGLQLCGMMAAARPSAIWLLRGSGETWVAVRAHRQARTVVVADPRRLSSARFGPWLSGWLDAYWGKPQAGEPDWQYFTLPRKVCVLHCRLGS